MTHWAEAPLTGAMTDPCPVCGLHPEKGVNLHDEDATPSDGSFTVCFGCGLVQVVRDGMRCALTEAQADWVFNQEMLIVNVLAIAKMRSISPLRVGEIVREQQERRLR